MKSVYITATASTLPNEPVSNDQMESVLGQAGQKPSRARSVVLRSNGIKSRHYAIDPATGEATHTNAQLTAEAVNALRESSHVDAIDCLACGTSLPDQLFPNHASMVQGETGLESCEVIATSGVCLSGMSAFKYAWMSVASGLSRGAIATGSELVSPVLRGRHFQPEVAARIESLEKNPEVAFEKDFLRWMLSDGAGAVYLEPQPAPSGLSLEVEWIEIRSYADQLETCMYAGGVKREDGTLKGWKEFAPQEWLEQSVFAIKQDVKLLNENIVHYSAERPLPEMLAKHGQSVDDVDHFLPHYSSTYFRERLHEGLKSVGCEIPFERWFTNLTTKGNTGAASIYIMIDELLRSGKLNRGERILCYIPESGRFSTAFMMLKVCDAEG